MLRKTSCVAAAAVLLLLPAQLLAGGLPWLCLPVDGVTSDNVSTCTDLLISKLKTKLSPQFPHDSGIQVSPHSNQWYLKLYMGEDVGLQEVEAALKGSRFSVPRDKLHLFGHVILEIDAGKTTPKQLLADLEALDYVSVAESENKEELLLVTVDMPYPVESGGREREPVGWDKFQRNDFASDQSTKSESPITDRQLPAYSAFRDVVAKHKATLKDIRWSDDYVCRPLGGVAVDNGAVISAEQSK